MTTATFEFRKCPYLFSAPTGFRTCSTLLHNASVQFQMKTRRFSRRYSRSPIYAELHTIVNEEKGKKMYNDL